MKDAEQNPPMELPWFDELVQADLEIDPYYLTSAYDGGEFSHARALRVTKDVWVKRQKTILDLNKAEADDFVAAHEHEFEEESATARNLRVARARFVNETDSPREWRDVLSNSIAAEIAAETEITEPAVVAEITPDQPGRMQSLFEKVKSYKDKLWPQTERASRTRKAIAAVALTAAVIFLPNGSAPEKLNAQPVITAAPTNEAEVPATPTTSTTSTTTVENQTPEVFVAVAGLAEATVTAYNQAYYVALGRMDQTRIENGFDDTQLANVLYLSAQLEAQQVA